ncbi:MAG: hypothetical protein RI894_2449 [Bacteroidota bacterium]|jgi:predicted ATP-dependent endonuclease of OLD family
MHIKQLYMQNFRGFKAETFRFNTGLTVAIGDNDMGKSTLLRALRVAAGSYLLGIDNLLPRTRI